MNFRVPYNYVRLYSSKIQAKQTLDIIFLYTTKNSVITDATSGIGGNSIYFTSFKKLICVEINKIAFEVLKKNLNYYYNIDYYNNNYCNICYNLKQDIIFLDPPWEKDYKLKKNSNLYLNNKPIKHIIDSLYLHACIIVLKCPINFECVTMNWDFRTHYIYIKKRAIYKIIVFFKY
jgi:tRNA G37 N-methylase Trm5